MADTNATVIQKYPCKCGCGTMVAGNWARGHVSRGEGGYKGLQALPGPDDPSWDDEDGSVDVGQLEPDDAPEPSPRDAEPAAGTPSPDAGPAGPDEPPAHAGRHWRRDPKPSTPRAQPKRVTQAMRADIDAKISLMLDIPGRVWAARDPVCGGTFVAQRPYIAEAFTDIVCQSPDLIAWFTGSGGQFMLWLNLAAACWPVATIIMAHHVYHSIEAGEAPEQPDLARYAA